MEILLIIIGSMLGVFLFLGIIVLILYKKFIKAASSLGYSNINEIKEMIKQSDEESKYRIKSISGMSKILVPQITRDYKNFNETEFYNKVETCLLAIFNSLSTKKVSDTKELNLIRDKVVEKINDLSSNNIDVKYESIKFHKHAIKSYTKEKGYLSITVASSLEYYFSKKKDGKEKEDNKDYKKQTSYTTKFVHIYDPDAYVSGKSYLAAHCPNCGAPLKNYKDDYCDFCNSGVESINLKSWFISEYKEDKR